MDSGISSISLRYLMNVNDIQPQIDDVNQNCKESDMDISMSSENSSQSDDLEKLLNELEAEKNYVNVPTKVPENMELIQIPEEKKISPVRVEKCNISIQCHEESILLSSQQFVELPETEPMQSKNIPIQLVFSQFSQTTIQDQVFANMNVENSSQLPATSSHVLLQNSINQNNVQAQQLQSFPSSSLNVVKSQYFLPEAQQNVIETSDRVEKWCMSMMQVSKFDTSMESRFSERFDYNNEEQLQNLPKKTTEQHVHEQPRFEKEQMETSIDEIQKQHILPRNVNETYVIAANYDDESKNWNQNEISISIARDNDKQIKENYNYQTFYESKISSSDVGTSIFQESAQFFDQNKSPPIKRRKIMESECFFQQTVQQMKPIQTEKFFDESEVQTLDLFVNERSVESQKNNDEFKFSLTPPSQYSSDELEESFIVSESQENLSFSKKPQNEVETKFSQEAKLEKISQMIEPSVLNQEKEVDTSYYTPYITKTPPKVINEFYKAQENIDEKEKKNNLDKFVEPSLEYLAHKHNVIPNYSIGDKSDKIEFLEQNSEDYGDDPCPNESLEAMMASFFIEKPTFVCSTPEKNFDSANILDKAFLNLSFSEEQEMQLDTNKQDEMKENVVEKQNESSSMSLKDIPNMIPMANDPDFDISEIFDIQLNQQQVVEKNNELVQEKQQELLRLDSRMSEDERYNSLLHLVETMNDSKNKSLKENSIIEHRKAAILCHVENILQTMIESLVEEKPLTIKFRKIKDWKDCTMEEDVLSQRMTVIAMRTISFSDKRTQRTFTIVTHLLSEIYKMLMKNSSCTKRELYYRDVEFLKNQISVNKAIDVISTMLNVPVWELGVLSTSKGLIAGNIIITTEDEVIDCTSTKSVPQNPSEIKKIESSAEYVLVVEKDTVFTRLIEENFFEKSLKNCILVTAKGYPDVNTRVLLRKIVSELNIPIYIIVDADPYGIEIMCTYKYGSLELVNHSEQLALSKNIEWIGIHPSDIETLNIVFTDMTAADLKKVNELMQRPYMNPQLERELEHMKNRKQKAEIENIYDYSVDYLIRDYIPRKISTISTPMETLSQQVCDAKEFSSLNQ